MTEAFDSQYGHLPQLDCGLFTEKHLLCSKRNGTEKHRPVVFHHGISHGQKEGTPLLNAEGIDIRHWRWVPACPSLTRLRFRLIGATQVYSKKSKASWRPVFGLTAIKYGHWRRSYCTSGAKVMHQGSARFGDLNLMVTNATAKRSLYAGYKAIEATIHPTHDASLSR
jgi:hypothetical protein